MKSCRPAAPEMITARYTTAIHPTRHATSAVRCASLTRLRGAVSRLWSLGAGRLSGGSRRGLASSMRATSARLASVCKRRQQGGTSWYGHVWSFSWASWSAARGAERRSCRGALPQCWMQSVGSGVWVMVVRMEVAQMAHRREHGG